MAVTPYADVPKQLFISRMALPCGVILIFLILAVGVVANSSAFHPADGPASVVPFWRAAWDHYVSFFAQIFSVSKGCVTGATVNEFQSGQCKTYWEQLAKLGALALAPFVLILGFLWLGAENLQQLYRRADKRLGSPKDGKIGVVTDPPEGPPDLFGAFYCLRPVMVQLTGSVDQKKVYIPLEMSTPRPGQKLIFVDLGSLWGAKRPFAMIYAPHVAILGR